MMDGFKTDNYNPLIDDPGFEMDIIAAAANGNFRHVSALLSQGTDVNARNANGWTPLMYACHYGHFTVVKVLVDANADVNLYEWTHRRTALMMAASNGHTRCLEGLISSGKLDMDQKDWEGNTASFYAIANGHGNNKVIGGLLKITREQVPSSQSQSGKLRRPSLPVTPSTRKLIEKRNLNRSLTPTEEMFGWTFRVNEAEESKSPPSLMLEVPQGVGGGSGSYRVWQPLSHDQSPPQDLQTYSPSPNIFSKGSPTSSGGYSPNHRNALPSCMDDLLERIDLSMFKDVFKNNGIDLYSFPDLTEDDFISIGIDCVGHRRKLLVAQLRLIESVEIRNTQEALFADFLLIERSRLQEENNRLKAFMMQWRDCVYKLVDSINKNGQYHKQDKVYSVDKAEVDRCL
jgi:hypothetical protein